MAKEFPRSQLQVNRLYHTSVPHQHWLYTPDGVGVIWFDSEAEALEQTGAFGQPILQLNEALSDH